MSHDPEEERSRQIVEELLAEFQRRFGDAADRFALPPACFISMGGRFTGYDLAESRLDARFPIREEHLNPYGIMQGGFVVAAADNTIGPLSMLVDTPSVTRSLESTYFRPVLSAYGVIDVTARLTGTEGRRLFFSAEVRAPDGTRCTVVKAVHVRLPTQ
jgi:acyl-coenzyme A thioesterase PaaI-like protein